MIQKKSSNDPMKGIYFKVVATGDTHSKVCDILTFDQLMEYDKSTNSEEKLTTVPKNRNE